MYRFTNYCFQKFIVFLLTFRAIPRSRFVMKISSIIFIGAMCLLLIHFTNGAKLGSIESSMETMSSLERRLGNISMYPELDYRP